MFESITIAVKETREFARVRLPEQRTEETRKPGPLPAAESDSISYLTGIARGKFKPSGLNSLEITVKNLGPCVLYFFVPTATAIQPKGFNKVGKALLGLAVGVISTDIKAFQDMDSWGVWIIVRPAGALGSGPAAPTGGEATVPMRSYCVNLHKLAPHPTTEYKFAGEGEQKKHEEYRAVLLKTLELYQTRQLPSTKSHGLDSIIQWSLWAKIEKMGQKEFMEEFTKLVHKNYEAKKQKWDKEAQQTVAASGQDLWRLVEAVLKQAA